MLITVTSLRILAFLALVFFFGSPRAAADSTYYVALRYLPDRIDPRKNQINTNHYIQLHLYYPLFHRNVSGELTSKFLDKKSTKSLSTSFNRYQFCLKKDVQFSDGSPITTEDLAQTIKAFHNTQEGLAKIRSMTSKGPCIQITLEKSDLKYFDHYVGVSSTLLKKNSLKQPFPVGLGPYRVTSNDSTRLVLTATPGHVKGTIQRIEFIKYQSNSTPKNQFVDFNHVYKADEIRSLIGNKSYQTVRTPLQKTYALVINLPTRKERFNFISCLRLNELREKLRPELVKSSGFLPEGMPGSRVRFNEVVQIHKKCDPTLIKKVTLYALLPEDQKVISDHLKSAKRNFLQRVLIKVPSPEELANVIFDRKPKAMVLGFDSSGSLNSMARESSIFFESFIREERVIADPPSGLAELISRAFQADGPEKEQLYEQAHRLLLASGFVLPLGQVDNVQFYPATIKNIEWADRLSGFPRIDRMVYQ